MVLLLAVLSGVTVLALRSDSAPRARLLAKVDLLRALPKATGLFVTADFRQLRQAEALAPLLDSGRQLAGVGQLQDLCGFDPARDVKSLAFGTSASSAVELSFGVAVMGTFKAEEIKTCASQVIEKRGGVATRSQVGSFSTLRFGRGSNGEVAVGSQGLVLLGGGLYLRDMIDAYDGRTSGVRAHGAHTSLRQRLRRGALMLTWVLPEGWPKRILPGEDLNSSPLMDLRALGVSLQVAPRLEADLVLACTSQRHCRDVLALLNELGPAIAELSEQELGIDLFSGTAFRLEGRLARSEVFC